MSTQNLYTNVHSTPKNGNNLHILSIDEWINEMWCIFTMEYYLAIKRNEVLRDIPVVQWLRLCAPNAGDSGSIPCQGTRFHMPQQNIPLTKTQHSQINKYININKYFKN